jgi:hypothetical protein
VQINTETEALEAINSVLAWAKRAPDSCHGGPTTGLTWQRGRVIATWTHDGTAGVSTYLDPADAGRKAAEMERAYLNWTAMRDARVIVHRTQP